MNRSDYLKNVQGVFNSVLEVLKHTVSTEELKELECLIKEHDNSKLTEKEFDPYCQWFFNDDNPKDKTKFNEAWNHHQKANPHHWQYWIMWKSGGSIALDMPLVYVLEMLCDWAAMSRKFDNNIIDW